MNYDSDFLRHQCEATACVDWVAFRVDTSRPTQAVHINRWVEVATGRSVSVTTLDGKNGVGSVFVVRFNDEAANDISLMRGALEAVDANCQLVGAPTLRAIEVACDFYPMKVAGISKRRALIAMTALLQGRLYAPKGLNPRRYRVTDGREGGGENMVFLGTGGELHPLRTFYIGNDNDPVFWRVYLKRTDDGVPLPRAQHRARVEVTLQHDEPATLGLRSLSDLEAFNFRALTPLFRFRRLIDIKRKVSGRERVVALALQELYKRVGFERRGTHAWAELGRRTPDRKVRIESAFLEPDSVLQEAVSGALRRLKL